MNITERFMDAKPAEKKRSRFRERGEESVRLLMVDVVELTRD